MSDYLEQVGARIRALRKQSELSQQALAEKAGISYKYLGEIERGQVNLSVEILHKITQALHVAADEIVEVSQGESPVLSRARFVLAELPERELAIAADFLESLKKHSNE